MSKTIHVTHEKDAKTHGKTDYARLDKMTEEEIEQNAKDDPDSLPMTDEQLKKFKRVHPKKDS